MPHFPFYNALSKRSENPVNELIGNHTKQIRQTLDLLEYSNEEPIVKFQVSGVFKSTEKLPKPIPNGQGINPNITQWGKYKNPSKHDKTYEGCGWHTIEAPLSAIPELIKDGFCLRYGLKEGGNDKKDFIGTQFLGFDLDENELLSIEQTLEKCSEYFVSPFIVHYSPSGTPDEPKLRLIVKLDEFSTDYDRLFNLAARITAILPNAAKLHDPTRFFYGTIRPDEMYVQLGASNGIGYLEEHLPELTDEQKNELFNEVIGEDESTANKRFLKFLRERVLDTELNGDPTKLVDLWVSYLNENEGATLYTGEWFDRGSQNGSLNSWNGTDPIKGSRTGRGDSFVISIQQDYTITFNVNHGSFGGDLVDLFYYLSAGSWDVAKQTPQQWRKTTDDICTVHGLESFNEQDKTEQSCENQKFFLNGGEFEIFYQSKKAFKIAIDQVIVYNFRQIFYQPIDELVYRNGDFYLWKGTHWQKTSLGIIKQIISESFRQVTSKNGDTYPLAHPSLTNSAVEALKNYAYREDWKNPHPAINCKNGILLLFAEKGNPHYELSPHDKGYWFTSRPLVNWNPEADCSLADQMLFSVKAEHLETFLRGVMISRDVSGYISSIGRPRSLLANGTGSNGKDILRQATCRCFGEAGNVTLDDFAEQAKSNRKFSLAKLADYSLNWSSENSVNVSVKNLKALINVISGGYHESERKGKDAETVLVRSVYIFNTNGLPVFTTLDYFILSRFGIIDFDKEFATEPKPGQYKANPKFDSNPVEKPDDEYMNTACEGLMLRYVQAWERMYRDGRIDWSASDERIKELAVQANQFARFIHTIGAKKNPKHKVLSPRLYALYQAVQIMEERASANYCMTTKGGRLEPDELTAENILTVESVVNFHGIVEDEKIKSEKPIENSSSFIRELKRANTDLGSQVKYKTEEGINKKLPYVVGLEIEGVSEPID